MRSILKLVLCQIVLLDKGILFSETSHSSASTRKRMAPCLIHSLPLLETIRDQDQPVPYFPTDTLLLYDVNMINFIEQKYLKHENEELIGHAYNSEK